MNKKFTVFILMLAVFIPLQAQMDTEQLYKHKVEVYSRMRNAGWTMTGFGGGLLITGTILVATLPDSYWGYEDDYYSDFDYDAGHEVKFIAGIMCIGFGVGLLAGGITLGSIGTHKVRQYQSKLDNLTFTPIISPHVQGISLVYRF